MKPLNIKGKTETAFLRILEPLKDSQDLSGFQWVWRFFRGTLKQKRISVVCGVPSVAERLEDSTPWLWNVPVMVEVVTGKKATEPEAHDEFAATVLEAIFDGSDTCAALNAAMGNEGFKAFSWAIQDGPEDDIDDETRRTKTTGILMMMPFAAQTGA
jgi:hypothetical protein